MKKRLAIVGTGIAGMSCAAHLHKHFDLKVFEKNSYIGGHTNTVEVNEDGNKIPIDTGFMVYNEVTYPRLTQLFSNLNIETRSTQMSFSVQHIPSQLEFAGTGWNGLFSQRSNLLSVQHWRLLREIDRFNKICFEVLENTVFSSFTVEDYCKEKKFSKEFTNHYLIPMSSAVWSTSQNEMLKFPIVTLVRFFSNHRFLSLRGQLSWRTVVGGSRVYRDALVKPFRDSIKLDSPIKSVTQNDSGVMVRYGENQSEKFDFVILACHADQALRLLESPSDPQLRLLRPWKYQKNIATLHEDVKLMPRSRRAWTSWNYRLDSGGASTIYWMNSLQRISKRRNYFISINGAELIEPSKIHRQIEYEHPLYSISSIQTQEDLPSLNSEGRILFCGSYFKYGFHEDALCSGEEAAHTLLRRLV